MEYLKIRKWDTWQTFRKDRSPPQWIKLHRCLMRNVEWVSLTDAERGQLVTIWLLAADRNGTVPADPEMIQRLCFMADPPNISKFIELEFLEAERLPEGYQEVTTQQPVCPPREEKRRGEKIHTSSEDEEEIYTTKKKRELKGKRLNTFKLFWDAFDYKASKAEAADAWMDIQTLTDSLMDVIINAAQLEAERRPRLKERGSTPKMAQGWISGRRWEDERESQSKTQSLNMETGEFTDDPVV